MPIGILCGLAAGALWGVTFIVPKLVPGWGATEIAAARFLASGAISIVALLSTEQAALRQADLRFWGRAILLGTLPVTVALSGRLIGDKTPLSRLALPVVLVSAGLIAINADAFKAAGGGRAAWDVALGALVATGGLVAWNLYALGNARILKAGGLSSTAWASFTGIGAMIGSAALVPLMLIEPINTSIAPASAATFWFWTIATGIGASWFATILWNIASKRLPVSLAGFLIVSETLFGLFYGFLFDGRTPRALEIVAIVLIVSGVAAATLAHRTREGAAAL